MKRASERARSPGAAIRFPAAAFVWKETESWIRCVGFWFGVVVVIGSLHLGGGGEVGIALGEGCRATRWHGKAL